MKSRLVIGAVLVLASTVAACGNSTSNSGDNDVLTVSVALYPIAEIVQRVAGDAVDVVNLTPPGTDAHDVELTAKQVQKLEKSDAVFYFGDDFQPGIEKAITSLNGVTSVDLFDSVELLDATIEDPNAEQDIEEHEHGEHDPHVWLDPANMISMTKTVVSTLSTLLPESADSVVKNGETYIAELAELGELLDAKIGVSTDGRASRCEDENLFTAHQGFRYLAHRAGLTLIPIAGINPEEQVSTKYLESLRTVLKGKDVTIFYESLIPSSTAQALATSLRARTDILNPVEGLSTDDIASGITYISAQRDNIQRIAQALGCS